MILKCVTSRSRKIKKIGLISPEDGDNLKEAYLFYRLIENALRMENENAPNELPLDSDKLNILARRIGFSEKKGGEKFIADYEERTKKVSVIYKKKINRLS
jgi:glutamine synthetase adenylyltransferase